MRFHAIKRATGPQVHHAMGQVKALGVKPAGHVLLGVGLSHQSARDVKGAGDDKRVCS